MKFRLKKNAGAHKHTDGRVYGPGDVVESDHNLALVFREKFETIDSPQPVFVGPAGGRTGNELPQDHAGRDTFDTDEEADNEAKVNNAALSEEVDTDKEDLAERIADRDAGTKRHGLETVASKGARRRTQPSRR